MSGTLHEDISTLCCCWQH